MDDGNATVAIRKVRRRHELENALRLVHDNYVQLGYMKPHPAGIRIGVHYALPTARSFIALIHGVTIATVSLFIDSSLGLPLDELYGDEVGTLRVAGRKIGEVGMLADRRRTLSRGVEVLLRLMKHVFCEARRERLDDLLITVNPKHTKFYQRLLCFEEFGAVRQYRAVGNVPAVLMRVRVSDFEPANVPNDRIRELFFSPLPAGEDASDFRMRPEDLTYFFVQKTDVFRQLTPVQIQAIEEYFPGLKISDHGKEHAAAVRLSAG